MPDGTGLILWRTLSNLAYELPAIPARYARAGICFREKKGKKTRGRERKAGGGKENVKHDGRRVNFRSEKHPTATTIDQARAQFSVK